MTLLRAVLLLGRWHRRLGQQRQCAIPRSWAGLCWGHQHLQLRVPAAVPCRRAGPSQSSGSSSSERVCGLWASEFLAGLPAADCGASVCARSPCTPVSAAAATHTTSPAAVPPAHRQALQASDCGQPAGGGRPHVWDVSAIRQQRQVYACRHGGRPECSHDG